MTTAPAPAAREPYTPRRVLALLLVGALGGLLSGAFGVGGGTIMVPLMIWLAGFDQRRAAATSLAAIVPTAVAGSVGYLVNGELDLVAALLIAAGGMAGSLVGTKLLRTLPLGWLRWMFIVLLVMVAARMFLEVPARGTGLELSPGVVAGLVVLGLVIGIAAGMFGIGGGVIIVPVLITVFGVSDLIAKGTSLVAMIPTATTGTVANARAGMVRPSDGLIVGGAAVLASLGGVALAFLLPPRLSAVLFGVLMLVVSIELTHRAIRARRSARGDS
ncbi:MAG: sulfite exporter TauE/SafE family protein [Microbacteriaceae bacterium]|nr:sulfite exporter TauE/SafE family protein [Microbacteriaceae bacterium]